MPYDIFSSLPDVTHFFKTARGSEYAMHDDGQTTRNRSGLAHYDKTEGLQPRSGKTVFMAPEDVNKIGGYFQNPDMATEFKPIFENGKPTGRAAINLMEDYGPVKKGTTMAEASYDTKPSVGMSPVEIYSSQSPIGDAGRGIHFGNKITEVVPKTGGGMGGAGGMTPLNPLQGSGLTPFGLKKGGFIDKPIQGNKKII